MTAFHAPVLPVLHQVLEAHWVTAWFFVAAYWGIVGAGWRKAVGVEMMPMVLHRVCSLFLIAFRISTRFFVRTKLKWGGRGEGRTGSSLSLVVSALSFSLPRSSVTVQRRRRVEAWGRTGSLLHLVLNTPSPSCFESIMAPRVKSGWGRGSGRAESSLYLVSFFLVITPLLSSLLSRPFVRVRWRGGGGERTESLHSFVYSVDLSASPP